MIKRKEAQNSREVERLALKALGAIVTIPQRVGGNALHPRLLRIRILKTRPEAAFRLVLITLGLLCITGCQSSSETSAKPAFRLNKAKSVEITPADEEFEQRRGSKSTLRSASSVSGTTPEMTEREVYELPKFTVARKGFVKFGMSVVTNTEVAIGGAIEWMRIGVVLPGSRAARQGLFTGIEILAIDNIPIAQLSREDMLHLLFERESGEHVRLLVYSNQFGALPRFITL